MLWDIPKNRCPEADRERLSDVSQAADVYHEDKEGGVVNYRVIPSGRKGVWYLVKGGIVIYEESFAECCGMLVELARIK